MGKKIQFQIEDKKKSSYFLNKERARNESKRKKIEIKIEQI